MIQLFDIFSLREKGNLRWIATTETMESALTQIKLLQGSAPSHYVIVSHRTGDKIVIPHPKISQRATKIVPMKRPRTR
jgi:hypothetical protein